MTLRLVSLSGNPDIPLDHAMIVVGRDSRCDVRIESLTVSRRHCRLALGRDGALVVDLGSKNGTRINGRSVGTGVLLPGDELAIAHCRFRLEHVDDHVDSHAIEIAY
jgi:pSer/pThr/pTyr-binding forkhead associated (FHA) protein